MISRRTVIIGLIVCDLAVVNMMIMALRSGHASQYTTLGIADARPQHGPGLTEDAPPRVYGVGTSPQLDVDIDHADLTIRAGTPGHIDVSVAKSNDFGFSRETAPIVVSRTGDTISVDAPDSQGLGDDRMVTIVVPPDTVVAVAKAGDITADGLRGSSSFKTTTHGNVTVDDYNGPALHVRADAETVSLLGVTTPLLDVKTDDGDVDATALQAKDGTVQTGDGKVSIAFADATNSFVSAHAGDGKITVNGDDADRNAMSFKVGDGDGHFLIHTGDGNIDLTHS